MILLSKLIDVRVQQGIISERRYVMIHYLVIFGSIISLLSLRRIPSMRYLLARRTCELDACANSRTCIPRRGQRDREKNQRFAKYFPRSIVSALSARYRARVQVAHDLRLAAGCPRKANLINPSYPFSPRLIFTSAITPRARRKS